jgi:hypothetical protein
MLFKAYKLGIRVFAQYFCSKTMNKYMKEHLAVMSKWVANKGVTVCSMFSKMCTQDYFPL